MSDPKTAERRPARDIIAETFSDFLCGSDRAYGEHEKAADAVLKALDAAGFAVAIRAAPDELPPHLAAEAAIDRHNARMGRYGYEAHPEFGKGLPK